MSFFKICASLLIAWLVLICGCRNSPNAGEPQNTEVPASQKSYAEASRQQKTDNSPSTSLRTEGQKPETLASNAHIQFEAMACNLGNIGPLTKHNCEFKLKNTGSGELAITDLKIGKDCARWQVTAPYKRTYAPGESGILTVPYTSKQRLGETTEYIYIRTNDNLHPFVKLTVNAVVEDKVYCEPRHIRFAFDKPNAGCDKIMLASTDGRPFSIKKVISTGDILSVNIDPSAKEKQFVIHPAVILSNLRKNTVGNIKLILDHPECESIIIPFEALPEFRTIPAAITLVDTVPGEVISKQLKVLSNYRQPFNIESVKSQNNLVEAIGQEPVADGYVITLKIIPPAAKGDSFNDIITLRTSDGRSIEVKCIGNLQLTAKN